MGKRGNDQIMETGLVIVERVFKPLKAMLEAYEARLKRNETQEDRYRNYPDPMIETKRLELFQKLIEMTQSILEKREGSQAQTSNHRSSTNETQAQA